MEIRRATIDDLDGCSALNKELQIENAGSENNGFLIEADSLETQTLLEDTIVFVASTGNRIIGYIAGYERDSALHEVVVSTPGQVIWEGEDFLERLDLVYVHGIGVLADYRKGGTAWKLFQAFKNYFGERSMWAAIIESPLRNKRSAEVVVKFGFRRVGEFSADECFGLKNYKSGLYLREP